MFLRKLSPPASGAPAESAALRRALTALLRRRMRGLPALADARAVRAARLAPVLLHASFERPALKGDAPGVSGLRFRPSWAALARAFDLPPASRAQRGAALVEAVVAVPAADGGRGLDLFVLTSAGLRPADLTWVEERAAAAQAVLAGMGVKLGVAVTDATRLVRDAVACHRVAAFGALAGGRLSAGSWAALESSARRPVEPAALAALAPAAPAPLARLALTVAAARPAPAPLDVAARLLLAGVPAARLADPSVLCARWASEACEGAPDRRADLDAALSLLVPVAAPAHRVPLDGAADVLALGRRLAGAALSAVRGSPAAPADRTRWREALGPDFPRALVPALAARLAGGGLRTTLVRARGGHEIVLAGGGVLGRGATPVQARVRALSLLAQAAPEALEKAEAPWRALSARLGQPRERPAAVFVVEPAGPSGPPFDPLNRGPARAIGFPGALDVRIAPGRRPSGRVITGDEAVERLLATAAAGLAAEVVPSRSEAHPVAARLAQVSALVRDARGATPVAVEAGGAVTLVEAARLRRLPLGKLAARPRRYLPDPDAPDLALSPGERRPVGLAGPKVIECRAALVDDTRASVLYADAARGHFREVVLLAELEEHLRGSRTILQQADVAAVLAVRLSDGVEPAVRRLGRAGVPVPVALRGRLPHDVQVEVGGVLHGGRSGRGWRDAARALLARWPRGQDARLSISSVSVSAPGGARAGGLLALWARSVATRRLRAHLVQLLRPYQDGRTSREEG